jgi:hypothetical protein
MKIFKASGEKGQSLVEMAITAPLLIFFLLGIFEVGAAIRNYLTLVNVNREITRFAVRPGYMDFSTEEAVIESYENILDWAKSSVSQQLGLNFDDTSGSTTLIVTHLVVNTGLPCEDIDDCDCNAFQPGATYENEFKLDDHIVHPGIAGQEYQTKTFGPASTVTGDRDTHLVYDDLVKQLKAQNNKFNCEIIKKGGIPSNNNIIVTELFHDQPQLFGFPLISNPFTDPVPLYTHTTMRLITAARSTTDLQINNNMVGYGFCDAYPFIVRDITIDFYNGMASDKIGAKVDIFDGNGGSDFGWLTWNPDNSVGSQSEPYLENELKYSVSPLNDYTNARNSSDHKLNVGDYIASMQGDKAAVEASEGLVSALIGKEIRIPVWDTFDTSGVDAYHIVGFVKVRIESSADIDLPGKEVLATYIGPDYTCN